MGLAEKVLETDFEALSAWGYKRVESEVAERANVFGEGEVLPESWTYYPVWGKKGQVRPSLKANEGRQKA